MTVFVSVTCEGCEQEIEQEAALYCDNCWSSTCAMLAELQTQLLRLSKDLPAPYGKHAAALAQFVLDGNPIDSDLYSTV
jgi:hypothetical protein